jgi:hypothetical protein
LPDLHHHVLAKRGAGWLAIGTLFGLSRVRWNDTYDSARAGEVWQPEPILYAAMSYSGHLILSGGMQFQMHRDNPANMWRWFILYFGSLGLLEIGDCSPYPLLSTVATVVNLLDSTVGLYDVIMHLDTKADPSDIKNGYVYLCACSLATVPHVCLTIASSPFDPLVLSGCLMLLQKAVLKVAIPAFKRCWGDDKQRKLWTYPLPTLLLGL